MGGFVAGRVNTSSEIYSFADAVASELRARGFNTTVFQNVGPDSVIPIAANMEPTIPRYLDFPNAIIVAWYPGVYISPSRGILKTVTWSFAGTLPRNSASASADMAAEQFGSTTPTGVVYTRPEIIIPDSDFEPVPTQDKLPQAVVSDGTETVRTTASGEVTTTQASVPGGQRMSIYDQIKALASAAGYVKLTWDQWNWYSEQVTGQPGPGPEEFGIKRTEPMPLLTMDEWWSAAGTTTGFVNAAAPGGATLPFSNVGSQLIGIPAPDSTWDQLIALVRQMLAVLLAAKKSG